jgi:hypothetical protein
MIDYIRGNPVRKQVVEQPEDWICSSAGWMEGAARSPLRCGGDWTPLELFLAGIRGWEAGLRRRIDDGKPPFRLSLRLLLLSVLLIVSFAWVTPADVTPRRNPTGESRD